MSAIQNDYRYIWKVLIEANINEIPTKKINYYIPKSNISPYFELNDEDINFSDMGTDRIDVGVNPFYRFNEIFSDILNEKFDENEENRKRIINFMVHYLANLDLLEGLNYRDIQAKKIIEAVSKGAYGEEEAEMFLEFRRNEKQKLALIIQDYYTYDKSFNILNKVMSAIYPDSIVYNHIYTSNVIAVYINKEKNEKEKKKMKFIERIFVPMNIKIKLYWKNHFAILGVDEVSKVGEAAVY